MENSIPTNKERRETENGNIDDNNKVKGFDENIKNIVIEADADDVNVAVGAGECEIHEISVQKSAAFSTDVGYSKVVILGKQKDYDCNLPCQMGQILYGLSDYSGLNDTKIINHGKDKSITAECGIGAVEIQFTEDANS